MGIKSIEVTDDSIKAFEHVVRKYNVDFAVKRDKTTESPKYLVLFKGKDADVIFGYAFDKVLWLYGQ